MDMMGFCVTPEVARVADMSVDGGGGGRVWRGQDLVRNAEIIPVYLSSSPSCKKRGMRLKTLWHRRNHLNAAQRNVMKMIMQMMIMVITINGVCAAFFCCDHYLRVRTLRDFVYTMIPACQLRSLF